jgi:CRP-like cAMP-binding protein
MARSALIAGALFWTLPARKIAKIGLSRGPWDMPDNINQAFDPKDFLAKVGEGKAIVEFRKDEVIFAQGDEANTVFYIQKGRVKVVVISEQGKEAVVGILGPASSLAKVA